MGKDKIEGLSFEQALEQLEVITRGLEQGSMPLAEAVDSYRRGVELKECAMTHLNKAKLRIETVGEMDKVADFKSRLLDLAADLADKLVELGATKSSEGIEAIVGEYSSQIINLFQDQFGGRL